MAADPTTETLGRLQDLLLESLLSGRPLPGRDDPLRFPDLAYITAGAATYVVADGYHGDLAAVTVDSESELVERAGGSTGYARFTPADLDATPITLRLQVLVPFPDVEPLVVGEVIASFAPGGTGGWTTVEPTYVLAT